MYKKHFQTIIKHYFLLIKKLIFFCLIWFWKVILGVDLYILQTVWQRKCWYEVAFQLTAIDFDLLPNICWIIQAKMSRQSPVKHASMYWCKAIKTLSWPWYIIFYITYYNMYIVLHQCLTKLSSWLSMITWKPLLRFIFYSIPKLRLCFKSLMSF